ncbi:B12-binding domain-containing radical SAM protein [Gloeobacter violaceus]|uniref:Gll3936 protein n=1 Tax=Gloeobacter violaceus (strain ATCC 29082 / PCC 7421) TaxID=251221 RepID=Q7NEE4_GLOVI|nr:B12-binding domain-containing radical SAM protein [Gloeobacter violaceus]BAC91877.1 gll3936 [Gloeobacter violaceus PCC 7421]
MHVLLVYPRFPRSFWSYDSLVQMMGRRAIMPPLGLITVAALLPSSWEVRLVDCNVRALSEADWRWCDLVMLSAMLVQKDDFQALIRKAKQRGKPVAVGGPYPTSVPEEALEAGADYLVLDEGEMTIPQFVAAIEKQLPRGVFRSTVKPDVSQTPIPRFDLLELGAYYAMCVQFSRGCPFMCEFCDITSLYGRVPRTKTPAQMLAELDCLYRLGWRGQVFMVDDNFIGNKRRVGELLLALIPWMQARRYPFGFFTEASLNLAQEGELLDLMVRAGFWSVFLGIETPDTESLVLTKKLQNTRQSLVEACRAINRAGLEIMAGFIVGFDGEKAGAGERIRAFVEVTAIPRAMIGLLGALPHTDLWKRLEAEGRLTGMSLGEQSHLMNFIPDRPLDQVAAEYLRALWELYEPRDYLLRTWRQYRQIDEHRRPHYNTPTGMSAVQLLRFLGQLVWRQGIRRAETRGLFWRQLIDMVLRKPRLVFEYMGQCAAAEHFFEYRQEARSHIIAELGFDPLDSTSQGKAVEIKAKSGTPTTG